MAEVIGVISGSIGMLQFIASLFASHNPNVAIVRVSTALDGANGNAPQQAEGTVAQIRLYNENQQIIGNSGGGFVGSGGFHDFSIGQINNQQSTYVQIAASNDAICIPYATTTWVDGSRFGWVGDFGAQCGLDWYFGNVFVDSSGTQPKCTWIDADHTNSIKAGMLFIHWPSFNGNQGHSGNPGDYCGFPAFRAYSSSSGGSEVVKRREVARVKRVADPRLVISSYSGHNATELCESETSRGPDFVSLHEGVYCNMETSETLPICEASTRTGCFDVGGSAHVKRDGATTRKAYTKVIQW